MLMNRKSIVLFLLSICFLVTITAQENINLIKKEFIAGSLQDKINILSKEENSSEEICKYALEFALQYKDYLDGDSLYKDLILQSLKGFTKETSLENTTIIKTVFKSFNDEDIKIAVIKFFTTVSVADDELISMIQNSTKLELDKPKSEQSKELIKVGIRALGNFKDPSSFNILFSCIKNDMPKDIKDEAEKAINNMTSEYRDAVLSVIDNAPINEKLMVLDIIVNNPNNSEFFCGEVAEKALTIAIKNVVNVQEVTYEQIQLQLKAIEILTKTQWTRASELIVKYFDIAKKEYSYSKINTDQMISVINCLTSVATKETGKALSDYLGQIHTETEQSGHYDEHIMLTVINSLGVLGEKSAFDYLLYVISNTDYSEKVITASREALAKVKW